MRVTCAGAARHMRSVSHPQTCRPGSTLAAAADSPVTALQCTRAVSLSSTRWTVSPMPRLQPSASYSVTIRTENPHTPGMVGRISAAIGDAGGLIGAIDVVEVNKDRTVRDFVVAAADAAEEQSVVEAVRAVPGVRVIDVADRTFQLHSGGKIEVTGRCNVKTSEDLSMVYTPGVARVCLAIRDDPSAQWRLTIK